MKRMHSAHAAYSESDDPNRSLRWPSLAFER